MYAIIQDGGKQYKVSPGQSLELEKKECEPGKMIEFGQVVLYKNKDQLEIGSPFLDKIKVKGVIERHYKGKKITIIKYRRREDSRRKRGVRAQYTRVRIQKIEKVS